MDNQMINWGGNGPILHIAHANSYHPQVYSALIKQLRPHFEVHSIVFRPYLSNHNVEDFNSWTQLKEDFLEIADRNNWKKIIGFGHSLGSVITLLAVLDRPNLFSKLIITEPPAIPEIFFSLIKIIPYSIAKNLVPPSKIALKRRHKWPSQEEAYQHFRPKRIFENWSDQTLWDFIHSGTAKDINGEYRLTHSKFWESKIYCTIQNPFKIFPKIDIPSLCIRAKDTDVIDMKHWNKWKRLHKNAKFIELSGSHLIPMEYPDLLAKEIINFVLNKAVKS